MKPRTAIYALVLVLATLAFLCGRRLVQSPANPGPTPAAQSTDMGPLASPAAVRTSGRGTADARPKSGAAVAAPLQAHGDALVLEEFRQSLEEANVPLDFYGQVIDQDSNALSGVVVKVVVMHLALTIPGTPPPDLGPYRSKRVTGADGRFEINGVTGDGFDLESMTKDGYEVEMKRRGFGPTEGSFANPVIFKMWSTNIHETLIGGHKAFDIVPDGRPYLIDFTTGTIAESGAGDLRVWVKYPSQLVRGETYDWSCQIDAINGGLLEEREVFDFMDSAPTEGYTPSFQLQQQIKGGQRGSTGQRRFYVRLNNGREYGRIEVELYAPFNNETPGLISLSYAVNSSGSRILR